MDGYTSDDERVAEPEELRFRVHCVTAFVRCGMAPRFQTKKTPFYLFIIIFNNDNNIVIVKKLMNFNINKIINIKVYRKSVGTFNLLLSTFNID